LSADGAPLTVKVEGEDGTSLVVKQLPDGDEVARARALHAQAATAAADSPAAARPVGFAVEDGRAFVVRPFVEGVSLAAILATLKAEEVPPDAPTWRLAAGARGGGANVTGAKMVCRIGQYAAQALVDVHARGAVHGALKPENLICDDTVKPTVTDFGCGHPRPPYDAPEVVSATDRATARDALADLYALGAVLHESLTRQALFEGDAAAVEQATLSRKPISPLKLNFKASKEMTTITLALLEKSPGDRYASAAELKADLDRYHTNEPIERKPKGLLKRLFG
ncbi:MAG: serine/threonine protein kinase, partial [Planctomycetota bacterium JB042]